MLVLKHWGTTKVDELKEARHNIEGRDREVSATLSPHDSSRDLLIWKTWMTNH